MRSHHLTISLAPLDRRQVASLGNRRKILRAIAALKDGSAAAAITPVVSIPVATAPPTPAAEVSGEPPLPYCDVLRSGGVDKHFRAA